MSFAGSRARPTAVGVVLLSAAVVLSVALAPMMAIAVSTRSTLGDLAVPLPAAAGSGHRPTIRGVAAPRGNVAVDWHGGPRRATWFVRASAKPGGNGDRRAPLASLRAVRRRSHPGDRIVVLPSPRRVQPLDGGLALRAGQQLVGAGPPVVRRHAPHDVPRIENTTTSHGGDAVRLAPGASVRNLVIGPTRRGGIYGRNVSRVHVSGNELSDINTSCRTGFVVQPFVLPTLVPGVGVPFATGLPNGWGSIMIDSTRGHRSVSVTGNRVHGSTCADGIDVRAMGTSRVRAHVSGNLVTRLRQDPRQLSVLAIGMQTIGHAHLIAHVDHNVETFIGTAIVGDEGDADSEGLFANAAGPSRLVEHASHNRFAHGLGHLSANCFEVVTSNGNPTIHATLEHSTCDHVVGDIFEAINAAPGAMLTFDLSHVHAAYSSFVGAAVSEQVEPGDDGDCMLEVGSGVASVTRVQIDRSRLAHCVADGVGVVSNADTGGSGGVNTVSFRADRSRIIDNHESNLRVANVTPVKHLDVMVERTDLGGSAKVPVLLEDLDTSKATTARLDLGGGALGSVGHNCIYGGLELDLETIRYDLSARHLWWGRPGGPKPGRVAAVDATVDSAKPLAHPPAACG
jgi:hypothetical protein